MSHFYGSMDGSAKTTATRCGTKSSGIGAHIRGWDSGVKVEAVHNPDTGRDSFMISMSGGSNRPNVRNSYLGYIEVDDDGNVTFYSSFDGPIASEKQ